MFEYIALIAFVLILSPILLCKNRFPQITVIYTLICFAALLCVSALRILIGFDFLMYSGGFFMMGRDGFEILTYGRWEIGFVLLSKTIVYFTRNPQIYMAILALISLAGPCFAICKFSKKVWLSVLLYINLYFFYLTMNFLRQSLAVSITMFALPFLLKKKIFPYIVPYIAIVALAATFHKSALIMLFIYFAVKIKPSWKVPATYFSLITVLLIFSDSIIDHLGKIDFLSRYAYAHYRNTIFWADGIDPIHGLIPTIIMLACIFFTIKFNKANYDRERNALLIKYSNLMYIGYIFMVIMLKHAIIERISYYAYIYVILFIPEFIEFLDDIYKNYLNKRLSKVAEELINQGDVASTDSGSEDFGGEDASIILKNTARKYRKWRKMVAVFIIATVVAGTISYNIYGLSEGENGVHGVYPYQSWLYGSSEGY